jgi:hypothetical protein
MKRLTLTAVTLAAAATAAAAEPDCSAATGAKPMWEVVRSFEENEGGKVAVAKVTDERCYEIYGRVGEKKVEIYYDPASGAILEREEG